MKRGCNADTLLYNTGVMNSNTQPKDSTMSKHTHIVIQEGSGKYPKAITLQQGNIMSTPAHNEGLYDGYVIRLSEKDAEKLADSVRATGTGLETKVVPAGTINTLNEFVNKAAN